jgi:peptidoglycan hydrolase-like protein with peptidoglycan-binding domain
MPTVTKLDKPVLTSGSQGSAVRELQNLLNGYASYLRNPQFIVNVVDGEFGPMTRRAVLAFQRQVFLPETGVVADLTWRSLYNRGPVELPQLGTGSQGLVVEMLQQALIDLFFLQGPIDGDFGQMTRIAVLKYQRQSGLVANGFVNEKTWFLLSKENRDNRGD